MLVLVGLARCIQRLAVLILTPSGALPAYFWMANAPGPNTFDGVTASQPLGQRVDPDVVACHLDGDLGERSQAICGRAAPDEFIGSVPNGRVPGCGSLGP